jgi:arginine repressor
MMARSKPRAPAPEDAGAADGKAPAADDTAPARVNKSEAIRGEARAILDAGGQPRPSAIVRALESQGIEVAPAMVSTVLKKMGLERRPRRGAGGPARQPVAVREPVARREATGAAESSFTLHQLIAAKKFVEMVGSPRQAMALLDALDRLM